MHTCTICLVGISEASGENTMQGIGNKENNKSWMNKGAEAAKV